MNTEDDMSIQRVAMWIHRVTWGYTGLHGDTQGNMRIQRVTWGYTG